MLLSNGAMLVTKSEDILDGLGLKIPAVENIPDKNFGAENSDSKNSSSRTSAKILENCTDIERKILRALTEPMPRANLLQKIGGNASEVNVALSLLEMKKFVVDSGGILRSKN